MYIYIMLSRMRVGIDQMRLRIISQALTCWDLGNKQCCWKEKLLHSRRSKYTQQNGVKGLQNRKNFFKNDQKNHELIENEESSLIDREYDALINTVMNVVHDASVCQNVLVIQPYVKWGPKRNIQVSPENQLQEAEALVRTLPLWRVVISLKVPVDSLDSKAIFGSGKLEELYQIVQKLRHDSVEGGPLTCLFISTSMLSFMQKRTLEEKFQLPVMDRYSMVIQILRLHATSAEARIQVAMAEIPYIYEQTKEANTSTIHKRGFSLSNAQKELLRTRNSKLKAELEHIRNHRKLLRQKRRQKDFPVVAVVGYTNAGKTSLVKALTDEKKLHPRNQLFATLDVTAHMGILPCRLEVLYMDTVGFMYDLPTGLFECFVATLEDAVFADLIIHVQDVVHPCWQAQRQHVEKILLALGRSTLTKEDRLPTVINVGNKIDLVGREVMPQFDEFSDLLLVSTKNHTGINKLIVRLENELLLSTNRRRMKIRIPSGGVEMAWLYKNAAVVAAEADPDRSNHLVVEVVITETSLNKFKQGFCQS